MRHCAYFSASMLSHRKVLGFHLEVLFVLLLADEISAFTSTNAQLCLWSLLLESVLRKLFSINWVDQGKWRENVTRNRQIVNPWRRRFNNFVKAVCQYWFYSSQKRIKEFIAKQWAFHYVLFCRKCTFWKWEFIKNFPFLATKGGMSEIRWGWFWLHRNRTKQWTWVGFLGNPIRMLFQGVRWQVVKHSQAHAGNRKFIGPNEECSVALKWGCFSPQSQPLGMPRQSLKSDS